MVQNVHYILLCTFFQIDSTSPSSSPVVSVSGEALQGEPSNEKFHLLRININKYIFLSNEPAYTIIYKISR